MEPAQQEQDEILTKLLKGRLGQDKKLKAEIKNIGRAKKEYDRNLKQNDLLLKESAGFIEAEEGEDLLRIRQKDLKPIVPVMNAERIFDLNLEYGFYNIDYTRNGNMLALAGTKGHIAILDWKKKSLRCEFNVKDKIRDIKFLQNDSMIAVAQKKFLYIYNNLGAELHRLKNHAEPLHLEYLPYHYLLASIGKLGSLIYQDISTGGTAADFHTRIQDSSCLVQNPWNAILLVGDSRGQTTMWCPNSGAPVVKMLCHKGTVNSVAVDHGGKYLVTAGTDAKMKVWDIRTYKMIHEYWNPMPASKLSISQKGLLAVGLSNEIQVWKDWYGEKQKKPYLKQDTYEGRILNDLQFVPYEDFLGVGLIDGFSSILIPGSGEPNFDTFETNVFQTRKQKSEEGVQKLLDKLPADTITLDPNMIGTVDKASREVKEAERKAEEEEAEKARLMHKRRKEKMRGRSSTKEKYKKKESVYDEATRAKIKDIVNNKLKVKRLEKKKAAEERKLIENEGLFKDFNPLDTLKKVKH